MRAFIAVILLAACNSHLPETERAGNKWLFTCFSGGQLIMQGAATKIHFSSTGWTFYNESGEALYTNLQCLASRTKSE